MPLSDTTWVEINLLLYSLDILKSDTKPDYIP